MLRLLLLTTPIALLVGCGGSSEEQGEYRTVQKAPNPVVEAPPGAPQDDLSTDVASESTDPADGPDGGSQTGVTLVAAEVDPGQDVVKPPEDKAAPKPGNGPNDRVEPLVAAPEFRKERSGALRVTFDDLDLKRIVGIERPTVDTPGVLPKWLTGLGGQRIRIRGFMKPSEYLQGITGFTFVRDNGVCCFGPKAKLYDMIRVRLREGTETDFIQNIPFDVEGTFRIEPVLFLDELLFFYHLEDATVIRR